MIQLLDPELDDPERVEREMVMFTWEMSLDALADYGLPQARAVLRLLSCYAPAVPIPLNLFTSGLNPLLNTPGEPALSSVAESVQIDRVLRGLDHLGLIDAASLPDSETDDTAKSAGRRRTKLHGQDALVVHPVIADTNRVYLIEPKPSDPEPLLVRSIAVSLLASVLDTLSSDHPSDWPTFRILVPHLQALLANSAARLNDDAVDVLVAAAGHAAVAYGQMRSPEAGLELVTSALSHTSRRTGNPTAPVLTARQQLAHLLEQLGRSAEAEQIYRSVLTAQQRLWPDDDPAILATRRNLGVAMSAQPERSDEAQAILQSVLEDERRVLGDDDPSILSTRLHLATLRCHRKQEWPRAEEDLKSLLIDMKRVLGPDDRVTLMVRHNLATLILRRGRRSEAEELFHELLADERRLLGDDHFLTASTNHFDDGGFLTSSVFSTPRTRENYAARLLKKGIGLQEQGRPDEAIEAWQQLIDRFDTDPDPALGELAAKALQFQGITLVDLKRPAEALAGLERAVNRYGELASAHPGTFGDDLDAAQQLLAEVRRQAAKALLDQGAMLAKQQQDDQAIGAWRQLIDRFSDEPDPALRMAVATGLLNMGVVLGRQRQADQAIEAYQELIDRFGDSSDPALRKRAAKAMMNRGLVLAKQEQLDEALHSVEEAVETYEELAAADPGTTGEDLESARSLLAELRRLATEPQPDQGDEAADSQLS
jgi:tetratricopeptide (TPR) repeat protein